MLGFYRVEPFATVDDTATVAALHAWCRREGYVLGVPYREEDYNGAFDTMLAALLDREDVAGVVMPTLAHLGDEEYAERVSDIAATGKGLYLVDESSACGATTP